jgi:hypothetical protein
MHHAVNAVHFQGHARFTVTGKQPNKSLQLTRLARGKLERAWPARMRENE